MLLNFQVHLPCRSHSMSSLSNPLNAAQYHGRFNRKHPFWIWKKIGHHNLQLHVGTHVLNPTKTSAQHPTTQNPCHSPWRLGYSATFHRKGPCETAPGRSNTRCRKDVFLIPWVLSFVLVEVYIFGGILLRLFCWYLKYFVQFFLCVVCWGLFFDTTK